MYCYNASITRHVPDRTYPPSLGQAANLSHPEPATAAAGLLFSYSTESLRSVHMPGDIPTFAEKLNDLFVHSVDGLTNTSVARTLTAQGCTISVTYLSQLRSGARIHPSERYLHALAEYFGVSISHFTERQSEHDISTGFAHDLVLINAIQDSSIRRLLCNAYGLSESHRRVRRL